MDGAGLNGAARSKLKLTSGSTGDDIYLIPITVLEFQGVKGFFLMDVYYGSEPQCKNNRQKTCFHAAAVQFDSKRQLKTMFLSLQDAFIRQIWQVLLACKLNPNEEAAG